ncbi:MAG: NHL repeat-containing protein [Salinibacter sp.]
MRLLSVVGLGLLLLGGAVPEGRAQEAEGADGRKVLARFGDARALAVDPRGRLYVADAARDVVEVLRPNGTRHMVLGGSGTRPGEFDTPSDVDPTNGQVLLVADTYNGRIQRFSEEGQYLESLPIGTGDRGRNDDWTFEEGRARRPIRGDGRPIAVARDDEGAVYVLDRRRRRVLKWSDLGQSGQIVGGHRGRLQDPVALAVGEAQRVYVADRGQGAILVYNTFGTFRRRVPVSSLPSVRALTVHRGQLWIVSPGRVRIWESGEGLVAKRTVNRSAPLVDVAPHANSVYLLTETRLFRRPDW